MKKNDALFLETYVNLKELPLLEQDNQSYQCRINKIQSELKQKGCSVIRSFIKPQWHAQIEQQGEQLAPHAYFKKEIVNAYNISLDADLPPDHPAKITMQRENAFVARDLIPKTDIIHQLYDNGYFSHFLADCFGYQTLYQLDDPLAGLCLNVLKPGCCHPWHYDINEFTVSLLTKKPQKGGTFRYSPGIRAPGEENLDLVRTVLLDNQGADKLVTDLSLEVGDLQLFQGRYSLHQVSPVEGKKPRHTAIFAYTLEPGIIGGVERTRQLFGRILPAHEQADLEKIRADELLD